MTKDEDNSKIEKLRDIDLYIKLYSPIQKRLYIYIVAFVLDPGEAEDLLQETNLVLWNKFDQFEQGTNFWAWARQIARNHVLNYWQLKRNNSTILLSNDAIDAVDNSIIGTSRTDDEIKKDALDDCLAKLDCKDLEIITSRYEPEFSLRRMASLLKIEPNTLSKKLSRIRRFLQNCVNKTIARES